MPSAAQACNSYAATNAEPLSTSVQPGDTANVQLVPQRRFGADGVFGMSEPVAAQQTCVIIDEREQVASSGRRSVGRAMCRRSTSR